MRPSPAHSAYLDVSGQPVSLGAPFAVEARNATALAFPANGRSAPGRHARLPNLAPDHAGAQALRGLLLALLRRRDPLAGGAGAPGGVQAGAAAANTRARAPTGALAHRLCGRSRAAVGAVETVLATAPGATLGVELSQAMRLLIGDAAGMRASVEAAPLAHGEDHPGRGLLPGCDTFALEETDEHAAAPREGPHGLAIAADDAWGLHAVALVHEMNGDAEGGPAASAAQEPSPARCNHAGHDVRLHEALLLPDIGRFDAALALFDDQVRVERIDDDRAIADATSLLQRLSLDGVDVGARWEELADLAARRTEGGCLIFADLYSLLALIAARRPAATGRIAVDAARARSDVERRMARPGLGAARGLESSGEGAFASLGRARPDMPDAGGGHARRDGFERNTVGGALRAGRLDEAAAMPADRTARRGGREDGYAAARRGMVARPTRGACAPTMRA